VVELAAAHLEAVFACDVAVFVDKSDGRVQALHTSGGMPLLSERESSIAQWVWSNGQAAGLGTQTLSSARAYYIPLQASGGVVGVLALRPKQTGGFERPARHRHLEAFAAQLALALERALLAEQTESVRREIEKEQLRSSLLSSVSHDLRTPLAIITGAASTLLEGKSVLSDETSRGLLEAIFDEAERLNRLIRNLLDMTRLESGAIEVQKEWLPLEEVVGAALSRVGPRLESRSVRVDLAPDLPLVPCDAILLEQVLVNLLENALKYSTQAIDLSARAAPGEVLLEVADRGPGIPVGEELRVFEKFHRARHEGSPEGVGLGLAICRAIIAAHNGKIWVHQREGGGTALRFTLPLEGEPPRLTPLPKALEALSSTSLGAVVESSESEPNRGAP
jgi:two-component system sensor histidine kinase KdpD